jgi:hypothetical protein
MPNTERAFELLDDNRWDDQPEEEPTMTDMQPTVDAIALLDRIYDALYPDAPSSVRQIILRAQACLERSLTQHLTGH